MGSSSLVALLSHLSKIGKVIGRSLARLRQARRRRCLRRTQNPPRRGISRARPGPRNGLGTGAFLGQLMTTGGDLALDLPGPVSCFHELASLCALVLGVLGQCPAV